MRWAWALVACALIGPEVLGALSRMTRSTVRPATAATAQLAGAVAIAGATLCSVAVLAWPVVARLPLAAELGAWSTRQVGRAVAIPVAVSALATLLGLALIANVARVLVREGARVGSAHRTLRALSDGDNVVVVVADDTPYAHALYGWHAGAHRILVSEGLVDALTPRQLRVVVEHERSHLRNHHALFELVSVLAVAINPLLRETARELDFALERWADEDAADQVGRQVSARALQRAGLARLAATAPLGAATLEFNRSSVPARVEALTHESIRTRTTSLWPYALILLATSAAVLRALERTEDLVEALRRLS